MPSEEVLIMVGHAWQCRDCRRKLLDDPDRVLRRHRVSEEEANLLRRLTEDDFASVSSLAAAIGASVSELYEIMNHPRCRLRHI